MKECVENLQKSYELSSQQISDAVNPLEVAALFEKEKVSYVLIGGHMLSYYTGAARATVDVDFIINDTHFLCAANLIKSAYSQLKYHDRIYHITFDSQQPDLADPERIDLIHDAFPLFREIVRTHSIIVSGNMHMVKIPTVEAAIALKFAASISPNRGDENKPIDNADLLKLVRSKALLDRDVLFKLGDLVYNGGGKELEAIVGDIQNGRSVSL